MNSEAMRQGLKTFFGHTTFRPGQMEIMQYAMRKENALGILATGGGKSLCYQLPALLMPHMTVVVSPLISLMADQVRQLCSRGIRGVEYINSSLSMQEHNWKLNQVRQGNVKILYVSPEKLQQESFMKQLATMKVSLFVVDEAHCISQWGHDFRTDYQRLSQHIERLGSPPVLALTATATAEVQNDICRQLAILGSNIVLQSVNRENICFDVQYVADEQAKAGAMLEKIKRLQGPGLVYFRSRNAAERACKTARQENVPRCAYYHGGMPAEERLLLQQQFLNGELDIIFATNAFGMGIDKPDIRFVIHYHLPPDMESYLQEVGRIGRNGEPGYACLLSSPDDSMLPRQLIAEEYPDAVQVKDFAAYLKEQTGHPCKIGIEAALAGWGLSEQHLSILLYHMENLGWIQQLERRREGWEFTLTALPPTMYQTLYDAIYRRREKRYDRLEEIKRWVQSVKCRREAIGSYFSQSHTGALAFCCDRCGIDYAFYEKKETDVQAPAQEWNWEDELDVLLPLA